MTSIDTNEQTGCYVLPRNLEIGEIQEAYEGVREAMGQSHSKFVLDAGEVALIDTAGVQFIIQLVTALRSKNCEVSWINDSVQIYQIAAELGIADRLDG